MRRFPPTLTPTSQRSSARAAEAKVSQGGIVKRAVRAPDLRALIAQIRNSSDLSAEAAIRLAHEVLEAAAPRRATTQRDPHFSRTQTPSSPRLRARPERTIRPRTRRRTSRRRLHRAASATQSLTRAGRQSPLPNPATGAPNGCAYRLASAPRVLLQLVAASLRGQLQRFSVCCRSRKLVLDS